MKKKVTVSALALGILGTLSANAISVPQIHTDTGSAFSISELSPSTPVLSHDGDHKCGEGKCGGDHKCGGDKKKDGDKK